eukprot:g1068.t1
METNSRSTDIDSIVFCANETGIELTPYDVEDYRKEISNAWVVAQPVIGILITVAIPLMGYFGAKQRSKTLMCIFCTCSWLCAVSSVISVASMILYWLVLDGSIDVPVGRSSTTSRPYTLSGDFQRCMYDRQGSLWMSHLRFGLYIFSFLLWGISAIWACGIYHNPLFSAGADADHSPVRAVVATAPHELQAGGRSRSARFGGSRRRDPDGDGGGGGGGVQMSEVGGGGGRRIGNVAQAQAVDPEALQIIKASVVQATVVDS